MTDVTRRSFVAGAAVAGLAAAVGAVSGCSPNADSSQESRSARGEGIDDSVLEQPWSFEIAPEPVPDDQIVESHAAEIVVVGSGLSGMVAAVSAAEEGADVIVVSASSKGISRGGSNFAFGTDVQLEHGIELTRSDMRSIVKSQQGQNSYLVDCGKWADIINNSSKVMSWEIEKLEAKGLKVSLEPGFTDPDGVLTVPAVAHNFFNDEFPLGFKDGAPQQVNAMVDIFVNDFGGRVFFGTPVVQLTRGGRANGTDGAVDGCIARTADGSYVRFEASKAVVLATGDFSRDRDMMAKYAPWTVETFKDYLSFDEPDYNVEASWSGLMPGDGHKMALWIGAAWQKSPCAPMVCNGCAGPTRQGPMGNFFGINMNVRGRRYFNETTNFSYGGVAITNQPRQTVFGIWDSEYARTQDLWDYYGCTVGQANGCAPYTPDELVASWEENVEAGTYFKADTIEELVDILADNGLEDKQAAIETIKSYNGYVEQGVDEEFDVNPSELFAVATPPFYAAKSVGTQFLTICGGIRTNSEMQALDETDTPIQGLYTTGIMSGDMYGNVYNFVLPGLNLGGVCGTLSCLLGRRLAAM